MRADPELELEGFEALRSLVIDSSTLICSEKAGFLEALVSALDVRTVPGVQNETGIRHPRLRYVVPAQVDASLSKRLGETDAAVFAAAGELGRPLATEDRSLIYACAEQGMLFYNAIMLLHFLLFRGSIDTLSHEEYMNKLLSVSRYGKSVYAYALDVLQAVRKRL